MKDQQYRINYRFKNPRRQLSLLVISMLLHLSLFAQVHFEQGISWRQIQEKARKEQKYIFVDCYATWCGPCKLMDQQVYSDSAIGKFANPLFISVKVQMDSTKNDNESVRTWYANAHLLMADNKVTAFPTFLFFSPNGKLLHKYAGYQEPMYFLRQMLNVEDPNLQEYVLLERFRKGELPNASVFDLIIGLQKASDNDAVKEVVQEYSHKYLLKLPNDLLFTKDNIGLMGKYLENSNDKVFELFYKNEDAIDIATYKGNADRIISRIIMKENIYPKLWSDVQKKNRLNSKPDWNIIYDLIEKKYNKHYAEETLINAKIEWYKQLKDWQELIAAETEKIEKYAIDSSGHLISSWIEPVNTINYEYIFLHSADKSVLMKAATWAKMVVDNKPDDPDYIDTYANLLYKAGEKAKALQWENKAVTLKELWFKKIKEDGDLYPGRVKNKKSELDEMNANLQKMKIGKATWENN
jgi:thioredoxin-related protein